MVCVSVPAAADAAITAGSAADAVGAAGALDAAGTLGAGAAADALPTAAGIDALGSGIGADSAALGAGGSGLFGSLGASPLGGAFLSGLSSGADATVPALTDIGSDTALSGIGEAADAVPSFGVDTSPGALLDGSGIAPSASSAIAGSAPTDTSTFGSIGKYLGKQNPLSLALAGNSALTGIQSLMPHKQVNVGQNAASVLGHNANWNATIPKYNMQNTATPYTGNWYTYGQQPEAAMYNAQPTLASKRGGMVNGYAHGGRVHGFAMGGSIPAQTPMNMPPQGMAPPIPPQGMPPQGMQPSMPPQKKPINPLAMKAAFKVGHALGKHLKSRGMTPDGRVKGQGGGQDDIVPARLSKDEYVLSADIPAALGDGSSEAGAKKLDKFVSNVRAHKTKNGSGFPPKAKNPLEYMPKKKG